MFKAELSDPNILKSSFEAISSIVDEVQIQTDSEGLRLDALDRGHITFVHLNLKASLFDEFVCDVPEKINIGYDEKAHAIGIKRHQPLSSMASYDFETREKNDWVRIGCKDFMKYLSTTTQIDFTKAKQFIAEYDEATETLIVVVDEAHMKK